MTKLPREGLHHSIKQTSKTIYETINFSPLLVRPPYGNTNAQVNEYIKGTENMKVILWSLDSRDYVLTNSDDITKNIYENIKPGDIILCHDSYQHTVDALDIMIDKLHELGYELLTVSQMLSFPDDSPHR